MYKIYILRNRINNKVYIGKTRLTLKERLNQHIYNSKRNNTKIYKAMNLLGVKEFYIELLLECKTDEEASKWERFYIEKYDSFNKGYNGNYGGNGCAKVHSSVWKEILEFAQNNKNWTINYFSKKYNIDNRQIKKFLLKHNLKLPKYNFFEEKLERHKYQKIECYTKSKVFVKEFIYYDDIKKFLNKTHRVENHIIEVCCGKRKSAYGYIWRGFE